MSKQIELQFHHWTLTYNGIVPTGNSDYSANHEYVARITYRGKIGTKSIEEVDKKVFERRTDALDWIDETVKL